MNIRKDFQEDNSEIKVGISSIIGTRQDQQDYICCCGDSHMVLSVVCDGMGGLSGGEQASKTAAQVFADAFLKRDVEMEIPEFFRSQAVAVNEKVAMLEGEDGRPLQAGTTIVAAAVQGNKLYWLSIGDSKIYIIRKNEISQVNREHNYRLTLKESLKSGVISQEQYRAEEKKGKAEALISYLGIRHLTLMDINPIPFQMESGDIVLLCSDGLYKSLDDSQIQALVRDNDIDMNIAADRLCAMALRYGEGAQDNTSVLLMQYEPDGR